MAGHEEHELRVVVVGSGPAGLRHVRNAVLLGHDVSLVRRAGLPTDALARELDVPVFDALTDAADWEPEAAVVATPPSEHLAAIHWALERACPVLVEKPFASSSAGIADVVDAAAACGVSIAVGYNLRFHPAVAAVERAVSTGRIGPLLAMRAEVGSYLPEWHPEDDYRRGSAARRELGGGAALTLSHELDYVLWIAGEVVDATGIAAHASDLDVDADDVAELVLRHRSGALSSVHMDFFDRMHRRAVRCVGAAGTIAWEVGGPVTLTGGGGVETLWHDPDFDIADTYVDELSTFLAGEPFPGDALADARRAVELVDALERR
jgi:predicted dehydrogenase